MTSLCKWASLGSLRLLSASLAYPRFSPLTTIRSSSLSAIHRGIRRSERAQHGAERDFESSSSNFFRSRDHDGGSQKSPAAMALEARRKNLDRLRKEKAARPDGVGRQSRRKRFYNPEMSFGKDSLVYKLQSESVEESSDPFAKMARNRRIDEGNPRERTNRVERPRSRLSNDRRDQGAVSRRPDGWPRTTRTGSSERGLRPSQASAPRRSDFRDQRDSGSPRDNTQRLRSSLRRERDDEIRESTVSSSEKFGSRAGRRESGEEGLAESLRRKGMMPMTVKYTTAASQFLYGRSVVLAALTQNRRQLYNLYVHATEDRQDSKDHAQLTALARSRGVPITNITKDRQRLMDKMSMGRPHNGFVLEASPLPQLPIKSLGKLEESPPQLGFHVELGHQTKEEEGVNGANPFIPRSSNVTPKPLVLLIHEIVDPGNLGALLRTASYLGVDAVGITNRTSGLTPVVLKSAAGAAEEVAIFSVDSPTEFLDQSRRAGWKVYAAVAPPEGKLSKLHKDKFVSTDDVERTRPLDHDPCVLVLGNEGFGLPKPIKVAADYEISIPRFALSSTVDSLNVSVAAGLLCHSFVKEKIAVEETENKRQAVDEQRPGEVPVLQQDALF